MRRTPTAALLGLLMCGSVSLLQAETLRERGEIAWERRAEGFAESGVVPQEPVALAVEAWTEALAAEPESIGLRVALMEAIYFQGFFATSPGDEQRILFDRLVALAEETLSLVEAEAAQDPVEERPRVEPEGEPGGVSATPAESEPDRYRTEDQESEGGGRASASEPLGGESLVLVPLTGRTRVAAAHFWVAASWGLWGLSHGNLAAARQGVAEKMRDHAELAIAFDETYDEGGGWRLLGRLNTVSPKVPFITGWIDRNRGIEQLERALSISRRDGRNLLFLGEALINFAPTRRCEGLALVREVTERAIDPRSIDSDLVDPETVDPETVDSDDIVEQAHVRSEANRILSTLSDDDCSDEAPMRTSGSDEDLGQ
ncbi:MAG: TRAP transporter TatT component family protein [Thermoanaerobaculia bacterium]|nr:TRAP transporter TatT component family protein [Thermoanaerobaculia bacterium]